MHIPTRNQNLNAYALQKLSEIGITEPTLNQIEVVKNILVTTGILVSGLVFPSVLTNQELTCIYLAMHGKRNREIANELEISNTAVNIYKQRVREKLKCSTNEQAVYHCIRYNYITPLTS